MKSTKKFMQTLERVFYRELERIAARRGITVQQLIRAVIVPEWLLIEQSQFSKGKRKK